MKRVMVPLVLIATVLSAATVGAHGWDSGRWHSKFSDLWEAPSLFFSYPHGVLSGSYAEGETTTEVRFSDVCAYLGHVCLCGAGGYRIARESVQEIGQAGPALERGGFVLISSRDNTVADVVAFVLGCSRRIDPSENQHFILPVDGLPRREYTYVVGYPSTRTAAEVTYRKHLLVGNEVMDGLWEIELQYDKDPAAVGEADAKTYREAMESMVREVLLGSKEGLITTRRIPYEDFSALLDSLRGR